MIIDTNKSDIEHIREERMSIKIQVRAGNIIDIETATGKVFQVTESGDSIKIVGKQYMGVTTIRDKNRSAELYYDTVILKQS